MRHIKRSGPCSDKNEEFFTGLRGYKASDTLKAIKLIEKLNYYPDPLISQLLKTRLEWECKQRLQRKMLDAARPLLKNNIDSAAYYFTLGLYFKDSLYERVARSMGYVKAANDGSEYVDWKKMNRMRFERPPKIIESLHNYGPPYYPRKEKMIDTVISYFNKAIELDSKEFNYKKQMILFKYSFGKKKDIPALIKNYDLTRKSKKWVDNFYAWYLTQDISDDH